MNIQTIILIAISAITVVSAAVVAFSRNVIYSAFALLGVFAGVFGLYIMLSADFVAVVQLIVYIGGILVLILFAVMLTSKMGDVNVTNRATMPFLAFVFMVSLGILIWKAYGTAKWVIQPEKFDSTTAAIGQKLLAEYLLPFEIVSLLLVLVLVGAVVIGRREAQ